MAYATEAVAAIRAAEKALDGLVKKRGEALAERRRWLSDLEDSGYKDKSLLSGLQKDAAERTDLMKALENLEASLKNANGVLSEIDRQAKKDTETVAKGAGLAQGSAAKAKAILKQLADGLDGVPKKAAFAKNEFDNLMAKIDADKNLSRDQIKTIKAKSQKQVNEIGELLDTLTNNLNGLIDGLRNF